MIAFFNYFLFLALSPQSLGITVIKKPSDAARTMAGGGVNAQGINISATVLNGGVQTNEAFCLPELGPTGRPRIQLQ